MISIQFLYIPCIKENKGNEHQLKKFLIVKQILPVSTLLRKCMENSMENIYTDVRVERVNIILINIKKIDANI